MKKILIHGAVLSALGAVQLLGAPFITSFTPKYGTPNDPNFIIINGSGFANPLVVKFNGVTDPTAATADGVSIQARVPAGAPLGAGPIFVSVNVNSHQSAEDFTVIGPGPYVAGFSPSVGNTGTPVTITGANFFSGGVNGTLTVKFSGAGAVAVLSADGQTINVNAPGGVTSGPITVANAKGTNTSAASFFVPPGVAGFSPTTGRQGTNVVITGSNLLGTTNIQFNDVNATDFTVLSNGAIRVSVPANATTGKLRVRTPAGSVLTSSNFVVEPLITGFAPPFGPVNTSVTVFGANLNVGTPIVRFNGVQASSPTGVIFGQLTAIVPAGATTGPITVTTTNGTATSATKFYLPAGISSVSPIFGPAGTPVTITGTNFTDAGAVTFNGTPAAAFSVQNSNSIGAIVPFGVPSGPVIITTPAGTASNNAVKFYGAPVITAFTPNHGLPGTNVTIFGQNFLDATAVLFNGSNATFTVVNNTSINAIVPTNAQTGPITVFAPGGTNTSPENFVLDYSANVSVSVNDSPDPVVVSSNVTYSIVINNSGPFDAPGVTLTDTLIGPGILKAATTTQGTLDTNSHPIIGALGEIKAGASATVTLTVTAQSPGTITNIATVASLYADPGPTNNSATNTTYVQPLPVLDIRRVGVDRIRISWPAALTNYGLETRPILEPVLAWSNIVTLPDIEGSEYRLTETNSEAMRFYRLRRLP